MGPGCTCFRCCANRALRDQQALRLTGKNAKSMSLGGILSIRSSSRRLKRIHKLLAWHAVQTGAESAERVRTESSPVAAAVRAPTDAKLLDDAVRVLARLLGKAQKQIPFRPPNHGRGVLSVLHAKTEEEHAAPYRDLIADTQAYADLRCLRRSGWKESPRPSCMS